MLLHTNANLVLVDVVVTERGNAVRGLDKSHFHILDDGREQPITSFDERKPASVLTPARQIKLPPNTYTNLPNYPQASAVNVLLLDGLNTPMADQKYVRRQMLKYMSAITPGTSLAIFTLSSRLRMIEGFTTDAAQLAKALEKADANPRPSVVLDPEFDSAVDATVGNTVTLNANPGAVENLQQFVADAAAFEMDERVKLTLDAMQQLARYLSAVPGRKNLIWFSGSFPLALDPDPSNPDLFEATRNCADALRETSQLLSAARVAVYPVDARGLMPPPGMDAASNSPSTNLVSTGRASRVNMPSAANDNQEFLRQITAEHGSMELIAEQTGGQAYVDTNGLKEAVAKAVENGSGYYTIGYVPSANQNDGQFHKIQIRADNEAWKLAYRRGYYADTSAKPGAQDPGKTSLMMEATLLGAPPATQILFDARVLPVTDPALKNSTLPDGPAGEMVSLLKGPAHRYIVDLIVDPRRLNFEITPDGFHLALIEFTLVAYDAQARRVNYLDNGSVAKLSPEDFAQTTAKGIRTRLSIDLPAGQISLRIAVHDLAAGRVGSLEVPVKVDAR
jgi:VWFA-related protein